ncbi:hypothetical protein HanPI659440_Chr16g0635121 [Helianthus annuus]|nr:hypothetical protein HanPI659440_Chr16g0635121 [Helianthus annuus]
MTSAVVVSSSDRFSGKTTNSCSFRFKSVKIFASSVSFGGLSGGGGFHGSGEWLEFRRIVLDSHQRVRVSESAGSGYGAGSSSGFAGKVSGLVNPGQQIRLRIGFGSILVNKSKLVKPQLRLSFGSVIRSQDWSTGRHSLSGQASVRSTRSDSVLARFG